MPMLPERRTVGALLAHLAQAMPQQEAVVLSPWRLPYATLDSFLGADYQELLTEIVPTDFCPSHLL